MKSDDKKPSVRWYDAGPISVLGMIVTGGLLVYVLWEQFTTPSIVAEMAQTESARNSEAPSQPAPPPAPAAAEQQASAPSAPAGGEASAPSASAPSAAEAPSAAGEPSAGAAGEAAPEPLPEVAAVPPPPPPPPPPPAAAKAPPAPAPMAPQHTASASMPTGAGGPYELKLTATAREVWVFVSADGGARSERRLEKGKSVTYKAERGFVVTVDDAAGVSAALNGKPLPRFGSGHMARKNITIPSSDS